MEITTFIESVFANNADGHDTKHTFRVCDYAEMICRAEGGDPTICRIAAMLHDVDDSKLFADSHNAESWLSENCNELTDVVMSVINTLSYHKHLVPMSLEGFIVQDADRLDALGVEGVRRAFKYGRAHGRSDEGTVEFLKGERGLGLEVHTSTAKKIAGVLKGQMREEILRIYPEANLSVGL